MTIEQLIKRLRESDKPRDELPAVNRTLTRLMTHRRYKEVRLLLASLSDVTIYLPIDGERPEPDEWCNGYIAAIISTGEAFVRQRVAKIQMDMRRELW